MTWLRRQPQYALVPQQPQTSAPSPRQPPPKEKIVASLTKNYMNFKIHDEKLEKILKMNPNSAFMPVELVRFEREFLPVFKQLIQLHQYYNSNNQMKPEFVTFKKAFQSYDPKLKSKSSKIPHMLKLIHSYLALKVNKATLKKRTRINYNGLVTMKTGNAYVIDRALFFIEQKLVNELVPSNSDVKLLNRVMRFLNHIKNIQLFNSFNIMDKNHANRIFGKMGGSITNRSSIFTSALQDGEVGKLFKAVKHIPLFDKTKLFQFKDVIPKVRYLLIIILMNSEENAYYLHHFLKNVNPKNHTNNNNNKITPIRFVKSPAPPPPSPPPLPLTAASHPPPPAPPAASAISPPTRTSSASTRTSSAPTRTSSAPTRTSSAPTHTSSAHSLHTARQSRQRASPSSASVAAQSAAKALPRTQVALPMLIPGLNNHPSRGKPRIPPNSATNSTFHI